MSTQLIFFDIDDTLCRVGKLDADNYHTLQRLHHETPVKIAIATGRGSVMLPPDIRHLISEGWIDAVICTNGQYNMAGEQLVSHYPLDKTSACALADTCQQFGLAYQQLSEHHIAWSTPLPHYDDMHKMFHDICLIDPNYCRKHTIYQFSVFLTETEEHLHEEYAAAFHQLGFHFTRWQRGGADILPDGASKARGITDICQHFDIPVANTMAFGDGLNDVEMLQHVGVGIAMGDGWKRLKTVADHVTGTIEEHGILHALQRYNILS